MKTNYVIDVRNTFRKLKKNKEIRGNGTIEIQNAMFVADRPAIFGNPCQDYIDAEIRWYLEMDRKVSTLFKIYGKEVKIWKNCANKFGEINSNYGWCIMSDKNGFQYNKVVQTLQADPLSRQAVMIYTNPNMHTDSTADGMKDFMCTNTVQYFNNDGYLECQVNMRSNDAIFGYMNDLAWQKYVLNELAMELDLTPGPITWCVGSLHVYERHYDLIK